MAAADKGGTDSSPRATSPGAAGAAEGGEAADTDGDEIEIGTATDTRPGFICLEPWLGVPDSLNSGQGLVRLRPGEAFRWTVRVSIRP